MFICVNMFDLARIPIQIVKYVLGTWHSLTLFKTETRDVCETLIPTPLWSKWTKTAKIWNFSRAQNCFIVLKIELDQYIKSKCDNSVNHWSIETQIEFDVDIVMIHLYTNFHLLCALNAKKMNGNCKLLKFFMSKGYISLK